MSPDGLSLAVVSDIEGLRALAPEWDGLVLAAARPSPFMLHAWVTAWWQHFGAGARLAVVTARRGSALVGLAPMYIRRHRGLRVCRALGGHESALGDFMVAGDADGSVARALLAHLQKLRFDYLDVFGCPGAGVLARLGDPKLNVVRRVDAPVLHMPQGWDATYASRVKSRTRNLHRRRMRQLAQVGKVSWTTARTPDEVERELAHAFEIHALRWRGRPDGSTFGIPGKHSFHREAARALASQGVVRIVTLRIDGRPIAFQYWFLLGTTMYLHRIAFDPALARSSPGQMTLLHAIAQASADGVLRVEFLGGDERYKIELADRIEPLHQVIGLARGPVAKLAVRLLVFMLNARIRLRQNERVRRLYLNGIASLRRTLGRERTAAFDGQ